VYGTFSGFKHGVGRGAMASQHGGYTGKRKVLVREEEKKFLRKDGTKELGK